jgi:hypothetical protein
MHVLGCANSVRPISRLIFLGWIPVPRVMNHMIRRLNVDAKTNGDR